MNISKKILKTWPKWTKLLFEQFALGYFWLVFGTVLAETKLNYLSTFENLFLQVKNIMVKTFQISSFLLVPFFLFFWAHSYIVIVYSNSKRNFLSYMGLITWNYFFLMLSWHYAYNQLKCNYEIFGILQKEHGWGSIETCLWVYLVSTILLVIVKNSNKVKMVLIKRLLLILPGLFFLYFIYITFIETYLFSFFKN
jgi:hypothetical protein